ncbi:serine/threonine-protein kinase [Allonocardiopsis opalescens]|uniref:serine/threonine-protein kinase n=1 Tax=Allonocardiopsis opalescens TaxID=1144618 RepID=UPI001473AFCC|nr:serine/threonine-protein kinase [Allonocardiopsis opalescens]
MQGRLLDGRYRLESKLGAGGMGEVWQARDERLNRSVAVKLIRQGAGDAPGAVDRFEREAQVTAQLAGHPNIVILYDYGRHDGAVFAVMELLAGRSIDEVLADDGPVPVPRVLEWGSQVCDALSAAHAAGVVHRDIKPSNLMLTPSGAVKVLDFGIAGFHETVQTDARLTTTGSLIGTAAYMSPEQARADALDGRSDLYALGCVLYELLTGDPPFGHGPMVRVVAAHVSATPKPLPDRRPDVPSELDHLITALLAKDPLQRPQDAELVGGVLRAIAARAAPTAGAERSGPQFSAAPGPVSATAATAAGHRPPPMGQGMPGQAAPGPAAAGPNPLDHPELAPRLGAINMAIGAGDHTQTAWLYQQFVPVITRLLGPDHPETLTARHNHAHYTAEARGGRKANRHEALRLYTELLPDLVRVFGADHPASLTARRAIAFFTGEVGDQYLSLQLFQELLPDLVRALGRDHATTLEARRNLADQVAYNGNVTEAVELYNLLITDLERVYGQNHREPRSAKRRLAYWKSMRYLGRLEDQIGQRLTQFEQQHGIGLGRRTGAPEGEYRPDGPPPEAPWHDRPPPDGRPSG